MAWNALTGQFRRKDDDAKREAELFGSRPAGGSAGVGGGQAPSANPLGGFGGTGGSAGAPTSASHVNYGTLYGANEEKAKEMANRVYRGAEKKAEDAKKTVADAQQSFQDKANANAGTWRPIGGAHGTRIESGVAPNEASSDGKVTKTGGKVWKPNNVTTGLHTSSTSYDLDRSPGMGTWVDDNEGERKDAGTGEGTRGLPRPGVGATNAGVSRYAGLYGAPVTTALGWNPDAQASAKDYHHSVRPLDAKSGAGQDYTGPNSLKESMGEDAYGKAAEDLKKAQDAVSGLQDAGGIAEALGYQGTEGDGAAAMDAGLTQTAGQSSFKDLARRYSGLGKTLQDAQTNSIAEAGRNDATSDVAAAEWDKLLADYDAEQARNTPKGAIVIGNAESGDSATLGTNFLKGTYGYGLSSLGFDMNDYNEAGLTDQEKILLAKEDAGMLDELASGIRDAVSMSDEEWNLWQSILAKLRTAKAKRNGGA